MRDFQAPGRSTTYAANGMCATSHPLAAQTAVSVLQSGGNAIDAAISAAVLLGLCEPAMCGIGGDCFALIKPPGSSDLVAINGSGRAPAALDPERLRNQHGAAIPLGSPDAVTIPGAIDAFARLSKDWGKIGLAACLEPAIRYCEQGVPVAPRVAWDWSRRAENLKGDARSHFLINGRVPSEGETFAAPGLAKALRLIARDGRDAYYCGEIAEDIVAALRELGGVHELSDFAEARSEYVEPLSGAYRDRELFELPPNGQGAAALLMAAILNRFDLHDLDPSGAARTHLETEAAKLAYDARNRFIGDPAYSDLRIEHMLAPSTVDALASLIDPSRVLPDTAATAGAVHRDTVYLTVVDADRMAVSLIYSLFHGFGSGIASSKYGVLLHNRGAGFNLIPGHPNEAGGRKRPLHTIIPAMLRDEAGDLTPFGVMGGAYQPAGHVRVVSNLTDFGMDPQAAIDAPRSFFEDGALQLETGYTESVAAELTTLGHRVAWRDAPLGSAQAITIDARRGVLIGGSDPRTDGCAIGY